MVLIFENEEEKKPVEDLVFLESRNRVDDISPSGIEVQRTFYLNKYKYWQTVVSKMEGHVDTDKDGKHTRVLPVKDEYTNTFWNQVRVVPADSDGSSHADSVDAVIDINKIDEDAEAGMDNWSNVRNGVANYKEDFEGGAFITGIYRPIFSAWVGTADGGVERFFDWLDPTFTPGSFTVPWVDGLRWSSEEFSKGGLQVMGPEVVAPIVVPTMQFSIRRSLLIDFDPLWNSLLGKVNKDVWTPKNTNLMRFDAETLRYDSWYPEMKINSNSNRTWDVIFTFTHLKMIDWLVQGKEGKFFADSVTWQHVLMHPRKKVSIQDSIGLGAVFEALGIDTPKVLPSMEAEDVAWYRPVRTKESAPWGVLADPNPNLKPVGFLYPTTGDDAFEGLFKVND